MWIFFFTSFASATGIRDWAGPSDLEKARLSLLDVGIQCESPKASERPLEKTKEERDADYLSEVKPKLKQEIEQPPHFESRECTPTPPSSPTAGAPDTHFCFVGETLVLCCQQGGQVPKPIRNVCVGDQVLGCAVLSKENQLSVASVEAVSARDVTELVRLKLVGRELSCTPDHLFFVLPLGNWVPASDLRSGDLLLEANGGTCDVVSVQKVSGPATVYNLETGEHANFFAGGVLVHNCKIVKKLAPSVIATGLGLAASSVEVTPAAVAMGPFLPVAPMVSLSGAGTGLAIAAGAAAVHMACQVPGTAPSLSKESLHRRPDRIAHHKDPWIGKLVRDPNTKHWWVREAVKEAGFKVFEECGPDLLKWIKDTDTYGRVKETLSSSLEWIDLKDIRVWEKGEKDAVL